MADIQIAFYKGRSRPFNLAVSWWARGPYSHCELIVGYTPTGDAQCWSSSFMDGGVRFKEIGLKPDHWDIVSIEVTQKQYDAAIQWFLDHEGEPYDIAGLLGFIWSAAGDSADKWFCSEAVAAALDAINPARLDPNEFHSLISTYSKWRKSE